MPSSIAQPPKIIFERSERNDSKGKTLLVEMNKVENPTDSKEKAIPSSVAAPPKINIKVKYFDRRHEEKALFVEMNKTDTVETLKTSIEEKLGIVPERQIVKQGYCNSVWLKNNDKLEDLVGKRTVYLSVIKLDKFEIELKHGNDEPKYIEVQRTDTVKQLREKVKDMFNIPLESLIISEHASNSVLNDYDKTLEECFIDENTKIICVSWDKFEIQVKFGVGKELSVEVDATDFLSDLEEKIKDLTGIPTEMQKLRFPDLRKLFEHNMMSNGIVKGDTILLEDVFKISVDYEIKDPYRKDSGQVEVNAGNTVKIVKKKIKAMIEKKLKVKLEVAEMKLKNKYGEIVDNDNETIEKSGMKEEGDRIKVKCNFELEKPKKQKSTRRPKLGKIEENSTSG
ncbi:hypothetical protein niasHT_025178 [Heterodera trifolii]|uniref:Ubiquitin-like domain-containing protein n=1 Tax=Heterodera trifolii TaxID=157864 RepID=A0ABD2JLC6_9BILA